MFFLFTVDDKKSFQEIGINIAVQSSIKKFVFFFLDQTYLTGNKTIVITRLSRSNSMGRLASSIATKSLFLLFSSHMLCATDEQMACWCAIFFDVMITSRVFDRV